MGFEEELLACKMEELIFFVELRRKTILLE